MTRTEMERELQNIQAELEEVEDMRRAVLGQTGVHVGARLLQQHRARFDRDQARLQVRLAEIRTQLDALESGQAQ